MLVHGGPFGNIAHGNNSILADRIALKLADYVVTEAGFASDLGFQKFCDIVCRTGGFAPSAAVLVTTVRATKSHGGKPFNVLGAGGSRRGARGHGQSLGAHPDRQALRSAVRRRGQQLPDRHATEIALLQGAGASARARKRWSCTTGFARGGAGAVELAEAVVDGVRQAEHVHVPDAERHADRASRSRRSRRSCTAPPASICRCRRRRISQRIEQLGLGKAPVCMAKTHLSLSHDPALRNRPTGFILPVRGLVPSAGAGFVVALCGDMQRMPGLGKTPAFMNIDIDDEGRTVGLF